ncbi:hypothetical protein K431DRAFT_277484 [Polychaeton citri CBS 116435]|uniref:ATP-grasp domain-containing protein n=1 Tax=Polychaeton citri CBS 116435 TaxID=1314669 RepID=A0A9P4ULQ6_9PEZI|nr:hypothetical protein K431DRAFT_277484 [Polychaeton citri CBS 116435]
MSVYLIARGENNHEARFQCRWHINDTTTPDAPAGVPWQTIDLFFMRVSSSPAFAWPANVEETLLSIWESADRQHQISAQDFGLDVTFRFVLDCLSATGIEHETVARLVVPQSQGYITRSDIIPLRLLDCALVSSAVSFSTPLQYFEGKSVSIEKLLEIPKVFAASIGGMLLKKVTPTSTNTLDVQLKSLDLELTNRLSFPWLTTEQPKRRVLALVEGGRRPPPGGNGETVFMAAQALGIDMVVLDNPGHWLDGPSWSHWRKAFLPIECTLQSDSVFTARVVKAIRSYDGQIDGLVTFCDHYKEPVAAAALELGMPTVAPSAFALATDKFKLRLFEGQEAFQASSAEQAVRIVQEHHLEFPLIIKPCTGYLSEGVFRVEELQQLENGVNSIDIERHGKDFAIEKYCDGPEVDANFILCDGELLFFEASDEFPKGADVNGSGDDVNSFIELGNILPSELPRAELDLLRDSLHRSLLRLGFKDGIYHLEARVNNSSMQYAVSGKILDIVERSTPAKGPPSAWLIEVNPRPPGIQASDAIKHTYGIDYWGLGLLFGIDDRARARQLSYPFAQGHQYWCEMVFIPVEKGGVYDSGNVCTELFDRRPDLADQVSWSHCFLNKGDRVPDPTTGINSWVAHFNVFSRVSRTHVLQLAETFRREIQYSIV